MSDIVERLRAPAYWFSGSSEGHEGENNAPYEAAARIERLEAALRPFAGIKADDGDDFSKWPDEVTIKCYALVHQIKEARAALEDRT